MRPSSKMWLAIGASVALYDVLAPPGETLSERVDDAIDNHPIATLTALGAVALHLANVFEHYHIEKLDVIHQAASIVRKDK